MHLFTSGFLGYSLLFGFQLASLCICSSSGQSGLSVKVKQTNKKKSVIHFFYLHATLSNFIHEERVMKEGWEDEENVAHLA